MLMVIKYLFVMKYMPTFLFFVVIVIVVLVVVVVRVVVVIIIIIIIISSSSSLFPFRVHAIGLSSLPPVDLPQKFTYWNQAGQSVIVH
jgi:hypothetical protein